MGLEAAGQALAGGDLQGATEEVHLHRQRPAVVARQQVDETRLQLGGQVQLAGQILQVLVGLCGLFRQHVIGGEQGADVGHVVVAQQAGEGAALGGVQRQARLHAVEAGGAQFLEGLGAGRGVAPEGTEEFESHGRIPVGDAPGTQADGRGWRAGRSGDCRQRSRKGEMQRAGRDARRMGGPLTSSVGAAGPTLSCGYATAVTGLGSQRNHGWPGGAARSAARWAILWRARTAKE